MKILEFLKTYPDVVGFLAFFVIYSTVWYIYSHSAFDVELLLRTIEAELTATSILLPATFLALNVLNGQFKFDPLQIRMATIWFGISIGAGVINLFRLPTIVLEQETDEDRLRMADPPSMVIAYIQLSTLLLGGYRTYIAIGSAMGGLG